MVILYSRISVIVGLVIIAAQDSAAVDGIRRRRSPASMVNVSDQNCLLRSRQEQCATHPYLVSQHAHGLQLSKCLRINAIWSLYHSHKSISRVKVP